MGAVPCGLSNAQQDAIGYVGGGILAICLIPQVAKVLVTRSARDISISWSVLYSIGLTLSLAYLVLKDATAAWIPIIFEIAGCLLVLCLKLFYEHTEAGRRFSAAKQQQAQELSLDHSPPSSAQGHQHSMHAGAAQPAHSPRGLSALEAAAAVVSSSGDISWRGRAVLGQHQEAPPAGVTVPMIDVSTHGGSHGGSRHGSRHGSMHGGSGQHSSWPGSKPAHTPASADAMHALHLQDQQGPHHQPPNKQQQDAAQQGAVLEVKCAGTSIGSCSSSSISATQESSRVPALQPQQQQQQAPPLEPLFASTWSLQPVAPVIQHHHQQ